MSAIKNSLFTYEQEQMAPYEELSDDELLAVVTHEDSHDCGCGLPEDSCSACYYADCVLAQRGIQTGHYQD